MIFTSVVLHDRNWKSDKSAWPVLIDMHQSSTKREKVRTCIQGGRNDAHRLLGCAREGAFSHVEANYRTFTSGGPVCDPGLCGPECGEHVTKGKSADFSPDRC